MSLKLKEAREAAGHTIEEVSEILNIRKKYLVSIEEGRLEEIPGQVYVEGYTKMYCEFLGIEYSRKASPLVQDVDTASNKKKSVEKKYVIFFSIIMLVLVLAFYAKIRSSQDKIVQNQVMINTLEQHGNNKE
jgi:cytoskeletal protein RodZ